MAKDASFYGKLGSARTTAKGDASEPPALPAPQADVVNAERAQKSEDALSICEMSVEELLAGPGGYTSREFEGQQYVSEDHYLYASDFAYCALHRLDLVLAEAERRGIDRSVMEDVMRHA